MSITTLSEEDVDKLIGEMVQVLNRVKTETNSLEIPDGQRPNFLLLLDTFLEMRDLYQNSKKESDVFVKPLSMATPKVNPERKKPTSLFGTPQTGSMSYFEHQARMRAEIKARKGSDDRTDMPTTPSAGAKFGAKALVNQLRDWLFSYVPKYSKILNNEQSHVFYFDDVLHLVNSFNPDMNELLSAGLSSKSLRHHLSVSIFTLDIFFFHFMNC